MLSEWDLRADFAADVHGGVVHGQTAEDLGLAALDALAFGAIVCDAALHIRFANRAAGIIAAAHGGLTIGAGVADLKTLRPVESHRLAALVRAAAAGQSGGGMVVSGWDCASLFVLVAPLPLRLDSEPYLALVTLRPADAKPRATAALLGRMFGLTPAEAQLVLELMDGAVFSEIAVRTGVSENTLRTQVAAALLKTGARNQKDLIRLIGILPQME